MAPHNMAAVLHGVDDLRVEPWPLPDTPAPGKVRVCIQRVGICGSDVHYLRHGRIGDFKLTAPMVIGHESAGIVTQVGEGVSGLAPGDAVALEPGVPCWHCSAAREGRYNLDPGIQFFATPPVHGSLANFVDHPAELSYRLPPGLSLEEGAMAEPLSVAVHACRRAQVAPGKRVAILGAGPIGLLTALAANAFGADAVALTDVAEGRLAFAAAHCPRTTTLLVQPGARGADVAAALARQCFGGAAPEVVIDCAGFAQTVEAAVNAVAPGGTCVLVGMGAEHVSLPASLLTVKEISLLGSFRYCNTYPTVLQLLASRRVDVRPLITQRFSFDAAGVAAGFAAAGAPEGAIKVMFTLPPPPGGAEA